MTVGVSAMTYANNIEIWTAEVTEEILRGQASQSRTRVTGRG